MGNRVYPENTISMGTFVYIIKNLKVVLSHLLDDAVSVYLKCVSRFFQWIRISNKEFVANFAFSNGI